MCVNIIYLMKRALGYFVKIQLNLLRRVSLFNQVLQILHVVVFIDN